MDLYKELLEFLGELKQYKEVLTNPDSKLLEDKRKNEFLVGFPFLQEAMPKKSKEEVKEELREKLIRKSGALSSKIIELTGKQYLFQFMTKYDMWVAAFNPHMQRQRVALDFCIDATNEAIGKLQAEGESWNALNRQITPKGINVPQLRTFISHGKKSDALSQLSEFLHTIGIEPLIVEEQPSLDKTVDDKVNHYLEQADFVIILATGDDQVEGKLQPRQNVIHEIGLAQRAHPGKIIYLLEDNTEFPSNIKPKVHARFNRQNIEKTFTTIILEIKGMGYYQ